MNYMNELHDIAAKYGFRSVEHLRSESKALGRADGDNHRSYLARSPLGQWFIWDDPPHSDLVHASNHGIRNDGN